MVAKSLERHLRTSCKLPSRPEKPTFYKNDRNNMKIQYIYLLLFKNVFFLYLDFA